MPMISLSALHADPRNANTCDEKTINALKKHIQRSQFCPALLVRPHPHLEQEYVIVDGHHRWQILQALGWQEVECQVKTMDETEAGLLLLTLNRLRGIDIPRKRAELIEGLTPHFSLEELATLLPENTDEIEGLLALLKYEEEQLENELKAMIAAEKQTLPVPYGFLVPAESVQIVDEALSRCSDLDPSSAFVCICRHFLEGRM